jgi:hypothetical protein
LRPLHWWAPPWSLPRPTACSTSVWPVMADPKKERVAADGQSWMSRYIGLYGSVVGQWVCLVSRLIVGCQLDGLETSMHWGECWIIAMHTWGIF